MAFGSNYGYGADNQASYWQKIKDQLAQMGNAGGQVSGVGGAMGAQTANQGQVNQGAMGIPAQVQQAISGGGGGAGPLNDPALAGARAQPVAPGSANENQSQGQTTQYAPGHFYSGYEQLGLSQLANDPAAIAKQYADYYKLGSNVGGLLNSTFDPSSILLAEGIHPGDTPGQLDAQGNLYNLLVGRGSLNNSGQYLDPRAMVNNIFNASYDPKNPGSQAGGLGQNVADASLPAAQQVQNLVGVTLGALQGVVPNSTLQAYAAFLQQEGKNYIQFANQNLGQSGANQTPTFGAWMKQRHGNGGGLF